MKVSSGYSQKDQQHEQSHSFEYSRWHNRGFTVGGQDALMDSVIDMSKRRRTKRK